MKNSSENFKIHLSSLKNSSDFISIIDELKSSKDILKANQAVQLLSENHKFYKGMSAHHMILYRGYAMESFMHTGLPNKALPYLLEELETSFYPYMVAAAARAIRGMDYTMPQIAPFLIKGYYNIWKGDEIINFSSFRNDGLSDFESSTSAIKEVFLTVEFLGKDAIYILPELQHIESHQARYFEDDVKEQLILTIQKLEELESPTEDCCSLPLDIYSQKEEVHDSLNHEIQQINLEDHDGNQLVWKDYFTEKYTVLSFFYTRCHNPRKCTQTIYNLVDLQKTLKERGLEVKTAAITYDPNYDDAAILKAYGTNRLFNFNENNRMFRTVEGLEPLIESLKLGVNFKGNLVNIHRVEVYIINPNGEIVQSFLRFQAKPELIADEIEKLINCKNAFETDKPYNSKESTNKIQSMSTMIFPILVAFFPKCPMCWASYLSLLGVTGLSNIPYSPWLLSLFSVIAVINLYVLYRRSKKRNGLIPFYLAFFGTLFLIPNYWFQFHILISVMGIILLGIASLLNSLDFNKYNKLKLFFIEKSFYLK